jgi:excisionase family DNA binding protein
MKLTIELTQEQVDEIAAAIAGKLGKRDSSSAKTLTIRQAAARLNVAQDTVRRRVKAGIIPKVPCLGVVRIPAYAIDRLTGGGEA